MKPSAVVPLFVLAAFAACRHSEPPQPAPSSNATSEHHHELNLPPAGSSVEVQLDGKTVTVDVAHVGGDAGAATASLTALFKSAFPSENLAPLHFDLMGSDGFRPTSRPKCTRLLTGDEAAKAHLDVVTHDVSFDDDLALPGCYRVRALVRIDVVR